MDKQNITNESISIIEIPTVLEEPIDLKFTDYSIYCALCNIEIVLKNQLIKDGDDVCCEDCNHKIVFRIIRI